MTELEKFLTPEEREELERLLSEDVQARPWSPLPGPQTEAFNCQAQVVGLGGGGGSGKTALLVGKMLSHTQSALVMRREAKQLTNIIEEMQAIVGSREGYNAQEGIWRNFGPNRATITLGSAPNPGDVQKYQGRAFDKLMLDELAQWREEDVRFLLGWNRSKSTNTKIQALFTMNPPMNDDGRWTLDFFGPWINKDHPLHPTPYGKVLYAVGVPSHLIHSQPELIHREVFLDDPRPFVWNPDGTRRYDPPPVEGDVTTVIPESRTFFFSTVMDNPYLLRTGYVQRLQALPEPLRSRLLLGSFTAGMSDAEQQVIPTEWIEAAVSRNTRFRPQRMVAMGVDVARGGEDQTTLSMRYEATSGKISTNHYYDELTVIPGAQTTTGQAVAAQVLIRQKHNAQINIDVIGVGASPYDILNEREVNVMPVNVSRRSKRKDRTRALGMANQRSELWWRFRELLDPINVSNPVVLPNNPQLIKELKTPRYEVRNGNILVEGRDEIKRRIGSSPDLATAVIMAAIEASNDYTIEPIHENPLDYNPYAMLS